MNKYEHWNKILLDEMCDHFKAFEECRDYENLCMIEKLAKTAVALGEMEAIGAMRDYAESEFGYDSETGGFKGRMREPMYAGIYNATGMPKTMRTIAGQYPTSTYGGSMRSTEGDWGRDYDRGEDSQYGDRTGRMGRQGMRNGYNGETGMATYRGIYNAADMEEAKKHMKKLTESQKQEWADMLEDENGHTGPKWSKSEVESIAKKMGIEYEDFSPTDLWLMTNVMFSDHFGTAKKMNADRPEFYISLAQEWLEDMDSVDTEEKMAIYFNKIVDHDDD